MKAMWNGHLAAQNRHYRQTLLATFHADASALPMSFIVDAAWCLSPPATSASKLSEKIIRFQRRTRLSFQTWAYTVRAYPAFHWKMASKPLLDEAMHKSSVKVGVGTLNLCTIQGFSGDTGKQKTLLLVGYLHVLLTHLLLLIAWSH